MEQNTNNRYNQSSASNTHQQSTQQDNRPVVEIQEEEITEITCFRNIGDNWYLPHTDGRTFNQNIKIRNR
ncbi:MAG: hypothetical protein ABI855_05160 [Bacteroidota bacterium]